VKESTSSTLGMMLDLGIMWSFAWYTRLRRTLMSRSSTFFWGTTPMWDFTALVSLTMSRPCTEAEPSLGTLSPPSRRIIVVLPAPLGPSSPKISPLGISRSTWSTATTSSNRFVSPRRRIAASVTIPMAACGTPLKRLRRGVGRTWEAPPGPSSCFDRPKAQG
jgi:hypothetical protein